MEDYEELRHLGRGAFGDVVLCRRRGDGQFCAVKRIPCCDAFADKRSETEAEVEALQSLQHPGILRLFCSIKDSYNLNIVTEYADAGDLQQLLRRRADAGRTLEAAALLSLFAQLADAVRHVHGHRMLHRDLKPSNVLLTSGGLVKLGDFGVSKVLAGTAVLDHMTCVGSPIYMAPEIVNGQPYGPPCDIWSLGVILYELCALRKPFQGRSLGEVALRIMTGQYAPLTDGSTAEQSSVAGAVAPLIARMLVLDPNQRVDIDEVLHNPVVGLFVASPLSCQVCVAALIRDEQSSICLSRGDSGEAGADLAAGPPPLASLDRATSAARATAQTGVDEHPQRLRAVDVPPKESAEDKLKPYPQSHIDFGITLQDGQLASSSPRSTYAETLREAIPAIEIVGCTTAKGKDPFDASKDPTSLKQMLSGALDIAAGNEVIGEENRAASEGSLTLLDATILQGTLLQGFSPVGQTDPASHSQSSSPHLLGAPLSCKPATHDVPSNLMTPPPTVLSRAAQSVLCRPSFCRTSTVSLDQMTVAPEVYSRTGSVSRAGSVVRDQQSLCSEVCSRAASVTRTGVPLLDHPPRAPEVRGRQGSVSRAGTSSSMDQALTAAEARGRTASCPRRGSASVDQALHTIKTPEVILQLSPQKHTDGSFLAQAARTPEVFLQSISTKRTDASLQQLSSAVQAIAQDDERMSRPTSRSRQYAAGADCHKAMSRAQQAPIGISSGCNTPSEKPARAHTLGAARAKPLTSTQLGHSAPSLHHPPSSASSNGKRPDSVDSNSGSLARLFPASNRFCRAGWCGGRWSSEKIGGSASRGGTPVSEAESKNWRARQR